MTTAQHIAALNDLGIKFNHMNLRFVRIAGDCMVYALARPAGNERRAFASTHPGVLWAVTTCLCEIALPLPA